MDLLTIGDESLQPTLGYIHQVLRIMLAIEQAFLPGETELMVTMRGVATKPFEMDGQTYQILLDLVRHKLRLGNKNWSLRQNLPALIFEEMLVMLGKRGRQIKLQSDIFKAGVSTYDQTQAEIYAAQLWSVH